MKANFEITKITIVRDSGPDYVILHTDLPLAIWPFEGCTTLKFDVARGKGPAYAEEHFPGLPVELIETKR